MQLVRRLRKLLVLIADVWEQTGLLLWILPLSENFIKTSVIISPSKASDFIHPSDIFEPTCKIKQADCKRVLKKCEIIARQEVLGNVVFWCVPWAENKPFNTIIYISSNLSHILFNLVPKWFIKYDKIQLANFWCYFS